MEENISEHKGHLTWLDVIPETSNSVTSFKGTTISETLDQNEKDCKQSKSIQYLD